jgi:hypothetical protein
VDAKNFFAKKLKKRKNFSKGSQSVAKIGRKSPPRVFSQAMVPSPMAQRYTARISPRQREKLTKIHPAMAAITKRKSKKRGNSRRKGRKKP